MQKKRIQRSRAGFTLVEIIIAMTVFAIIMTSASSVFYLMHDSWRRQKNIWDMLNDAQWAMEFMANEIRSGSADTVVNETCSGSPCSGSQKAVNIKFVAYPGGNTVRYWRGDGTVLGEANVLYRGIGNNFNNAVANADMMARFIANDASNGSAYDVFSPQGSGGIYTITLVTRPKPNKLDAKGNRSFTLRTQIRPRN